MDRAALLIAARDLCGVDANGLNCLNRLATQGIREAVEKMFYQVPAFELMSPEQMITKFKETDTLTKQQEQVFLNMGDELAGRLSAVYLEFKRSGL